MNLMAIPMAFIGTVLLYPGFLKGLKFTYQFDQPKINQTKILLNLNHQNKNEVTYFSSQSCITYDCFR